VQAEDGKEAAALASTDRREFEKRVAELAP
jgi:hypothetical protein